MAPATPRQSSDSIPFGRLQLDSPFMGNSLQLNWDESNPPVGSVNSWIEMIRWFFQQFSHNQPPFQHARSKIGGKFDLSPNLEQLLRVVKDDPAAVGNAADYYDAVSLIVKHFNEFAKELKPYASSAEVLSWCVAACDQQLGRIICKATYSRSLGSISSNIDNFEQIQQILDEFPLTDKDVVMALGLKMGHFVLYVATVTKIKHVVGVKDVPVPIRDYKRLMGFFRKGHCPFDFVDEMFGSCTYRSIPFATAIFINNYSDDDSIEDLVKKEIISRMVTATRFISPKPYAPAPPGLLTLNAGTTNELVVKVSSQTTPIRIDALSKQEPIIFYNHTVKRTAAITPKRGSTVRPTIKLDPDCEPSAKKPHIEHSPSSFADNNNTATPCFSYLNIKRDVGVDGTPAIFPPPVSPKQMLPAPQQIASEIANMVAPHIFNRDGIIEQQAATIRQMSKELDEFEKKVRMVEETVAAMRMGNAKLLGEMTAAQKQIDEQKLCLAAKNAQIAELNATIQKKEIKENLLMDTIYHHEARHQESQAANDETPATRTNSSVSCNSTDSDELRKEIAHLKSELEEKDHRLLVEEAVKSELELSVQSYKEQLQSKENLVNRLRLLLIGKGCVEVKLEPAE